MHKSLVFKPGKCLYFAYGSNMFAFRMRMLNRSAEFVTIARIDNYRVEFITYSRFWGGPLPTLVPTANAYVWGVIWRLNEEDMIRLDVQVGVDVDKYYSTYLKAHTPHMGSVVCRTHIQTRNPLPRGDKDQIPVERWPSWALREIMVYGAYEHGLPEYYINALKALKHNGEEGAIRVMVLLNVYTRDPPCTCPPMNYHAKSEYILDVDEIRGTKGFKKGFYKQQKRFNYTSNTVIR